MFWSQKRRGLYYMLPGMNRSNRMRARKVLAWALVAGALVAGLIGFVMYWVATAHRRV